MRPEAKAVSLLLASAVLTMLLWVLNPMDAGGPPPPPPPPPPPCPEERAESEASDRMDTDDQGAMLALVCENLEPIDESEQLSVDGDSALLRYSRLATRIGPELVPHARVFQAGTLAQNIEQARALLGPLVADERSPPILRAVARTKLARAELRAREHERVLAVLAPLDLLDDELPAPLRADAAFLQGRAQLAAGDREAALAMFLAATSLDRYFSIAQIELLRVLDNLLSAPNSPAIEREAAFQQAMLAVGALRQVRIARRRATDLLEDLLSRSCSQPECALLRAMLARLTLVDGYARSAHAELVDVCAVTRCTPPVVAGLARLGELLEEAREESDAADGQEESS